MAALVAPGICRYAVNGEFNGRPVVNILDFRIDTTGSTEGRDAAVDAMAGIIINEWSDHILPLVTNQYTAVNVSWVDLNSLQGTTGERASTDQETWPQDGTNTGAAAQGNVAYRVNKSVTSARGLRQGRMYVCGVSEEANVSTNANSVASAVVTEWNEALEDFLGNLNQNDDVGLDYDSRLCVVHVVGETYAGSSDVTALTLDTTFGSQRRRLRG